MKQYKKRIFGILLSFALMLTMMPVLGVDQAAYAGNPSPSISVIPENSGSVGVSYDSGNCTLTATASEGKAFDHWSYSDDGSPTTETENPWTVDEHTIMNYSNITAHFVDAYPLWVGGTQVTSVNASNILGNDTASYKESTNTLTLNGANITTGYVYSGIYYNGKDPLNIVLADGSVNTIEKNEEYGLENGIFVDDSSSDPAGLAISGKGKLTVSGGHSGICANYSGVSISGSTVTAIGGWDGIYADSGIDISGGNVNATGMYSGIYADGSVTINSGNIEAEGRYGITGKLVTINDGTVNATGTESDLEPTGMSAMAHYDPAGMFAREILEIKGGKVTAAGDGYGILGTVKNHIDGTAWTDKAGTAGKTAIAINKEGQDLVAYKKVQFPAKADPTPTPTPKTNAPKVTTTAKTSAMAMTVKWTMKWGKVTGAKSYKVAYRKVGSKKWTYKNTKKTSYVVKGHKMKGLYEYKVGAVSKEGTTWSGTSRRYFSGVKANAKAAKGAIKASWKKDKGATGYQVLVATNKKMNNSKVYNVSSSAKSYKVNGLKKGKTYYVRVRPMKNAGGVTYKGILSKTHKVKVK